MQANEIGQAVMMIHNCSPTAVDQVFDRLALHQVKINLPKCEFGSDDVAYLGFKMTKEGIKPQGR